MSFLEQIGTSTAAFEEATGASVTAAFELIKSGAYKGTVKSIYTYKNQWGGVQMKYIVNIPEFDRDIEFRQDIGAKLKPDSNGVAADNIGYANRIKQFCYATGVDMETLTLAPTVTKIKIYGKDVDAQAVLGMNDKPVLALIRYSQDTEKADGASYQFRNDIEGVCALNGTDASGENAQEVFTAKAEKSNGVFKFKGPAAKTSTDAAAPMSDTAKEAARSLI